MNRRIIQKQQRGNFVTLILSCGHTIKRTLAWWQNYPDYKERKCHCPQCGGYRQ